MLSSFSNHRKPFCKEFATEGEMVRAMRKSGVSEAAIQRCVDEMKPQPLFDYNSRGGLVQYSPVDGSPVAPHAPTREEDQRRYDNPDYRQVVEDRYHNPNHKPNSAEG